MTTRNAEISAFAISPSLIAVIGVMIGIGTATFLLRLAGDHPGTAWQSYLVNFLLFSAIAQGGVMFSALMHTVKARWSGPHSNVAAAFSAFFPVSLFLFILLYAGKSHLFPWLGEDLHGKEAWLNVPFLFSRDLLGLLILYGFGFAYLFYALRPEIDSRHSGTGLRRWLIRQWETAVPDEETAKKRTGLFAILYLLAFALILSLIGYDLVMSADPHWYSTLFGAYSFVKAIYVGLGGLIILSAILHLTPSVAFDLKENQFHDIGKLFFGFCLVWADFFYCQFVVIWYGNIPEETAYIIERTMRAPWSHLAWTVFAVCFIAPFVILLNKKIKTMPRAMTVICTVIIIGIWLEHYLVLGPAFHHGADSLPLHVFDGLMALGFLGLMIAAIAWFLSQFPELARTVPPPHGREETT